MKLCIENIYKSNQNIEHFKETLQVRKFVERHIALIERVSPDDNFTVTGAVFYCCLPECLLTIDNNAWHASKNSDHCPSASPSTTIGLKCRHKRQPFLFDLGLVLTAKRSAVTFFLNKRSHQKHIPIKSSIQVEKVIGNVMKTNVNEVALQSVCNRMKKQRDRKSTNGD